MTTLRQAAEQALEALEQYTGVVSSTNDPNAWITVVDSGKPARDAIAVLREALAEQKLKPCRSPYCECEQGKCTHPGFYDARGEQPAQHQEPVTHGGRPMTLRECMEAEEPAKGEEHMTALQRAAEQALEALNRSDYLGWQFNIPVIKALRAALAEPERKPLTDEEIRDLWSWSITAEAERTATTQQHAFARAIEAKLKEKNT